MTMEPISLQRERKRLAGSMYRLRGYSSAMLGLITLNRYLGLGKLKPLSISAAEYVASHDVVKMIGEN